jgi:hypothetical protein
MVQEGPKHIGVRYKLWHFMFLISRAFVGKKNLYLSKCTVKQQLKNIASKFKLYKTVNLTLQGIFFYQNEGCQLNDELADSCCILLMTGSR